MSLFRTSSRLLAASRIAPVVRAPVVAIRHKSDTTKECDVAHPHPHPPRHAPNAAPPAAWPEEEPSAVSSIAAHEGVPEVPIDTATSAYSPTPKYPDIRPEGDILNAAFISGAPLELQSRVVRIYKPAKPATQSGNWNGRQWRMDWDVLPRGHRWENPLMGWQSSGDSMQGTHIFFNSKEDAILFAEKQGYQWFIQEPKHRHLEAKSYAENFLHSPGKLKIIRTK